MLEIAFGVAFGIILAIVGLSLIFNPTFWKIAGLIVALWILICLFIWNSAVTGTIVAAVLVVSITIITSKQILKNSNSSLPVKPKPFWFPEIKGHKRFLAWIYIIVAIAVVVGLVSNAARP